MAKLNRYGRKLLPLPLPRLVTFYNGEDETEDETILSLGERKNCISAAII